MEKILKALRHLKVETGSLACLGCGHENNCSTKGCAILRQAEEELKRQSVELEAMRTAATSLKMHLEAGSKVDIEKSAKNILDRVQQKLGISAEQLMDLVQAYQDGRVITFPFVAMVEQSLTNGEMKPQRDQRFNGRYAVVYNDPKKWNCPLIDICGKAYNSGEANERKNAIEHKAAEAALKGEQQ